jgi:hypothetical protein
MAWAIWRLAAGGVATSASPTEQNRNLEPWLTAQRTRLQEGVHLGRYHLARRRFHLFSDRRGSRRVALPLRGEKTPNGEIPQVDTCAESARPLTAQLSFFRVRSGGGRQTGNPVT